MKKIAIFIKSILILFILFLSTNSVKAVIVLDYDGTTYLCGSMEVDYENDRITFIDCHGLIGEVIVAGSTGGESTGSSSTSSGTSTGSESTGTTTGGSSGGGTSTENTTSTTNSYPIQKADLGDSDFIIQIKKVLQDFGVFILVNFMMK